LPSQSKFIYVYNKTLKDCRGRRGRVGFSEGEPAATKNFAKFVRGKGRQVKLK